MGSQTQGDLVTTTGYLITAYEAAERLGCTEQMVRKMARDGRFPSVKVGTLLRFRPVDVDRFVEANLREAVR